MIPTSGQLSFNDIRTELGISGSISLNDTGIRGLVSKPSGQIALGDFYGKSSVSASYAPTPPFNYYGFIPSKPFRANTNPYFEITVLTNACLGINPIYMPKITIFGVSFQVMSNSGVNPPTITYAITNGWYSGTTAIPGTHFYAGEVIGCYLNSATSTVYFTSNGVLLGGQASTYVPDYYAILTDTSHSNISGVFSMNIGNSPFKYSVPTGYLPYNQCV